MSNRAVVDSTCLIALEGIDRLDILKELFAEVLAPTSVAVEFGETTTAHYGGITDLSPLRGVKGQFYEGGIRVPLN